MRRDKTKTLTSKKTLRRHTDIDKKQENDVKKSKIIDTFYTNDNFTDDDVIDIMNESSDYELNVPQMTAISDADEVVATLKNLNKILNNDDKLEKAQILLNFNETDPTLEFQFLHRKLKKNIFLSAIKTRLEWQIGEFPFFKVDVRYYNQKTTLYKNKRRVHRKIKFSLIQDIVTSKYYDMPYPESDWPCKGLIYITNMRVFFKKNKHDSFYICFDNIISYGFYENAMVIEHFTYNQKAVDVFYLDPEQARLLETMIQMTL
jgi:hypothetical protein